MVGALAGRVEAERLGMMDTTKADLVAIRRTFMRSGRDGAIAEMKRRFPWVTDDNASVLIDMALTMELPDYAGRSQARRDGPR